MNLNIDLRTTGPLSHDDAMALQREELARAIDVVRRLTP